MYHGEKINPDRDRDCNQQRRRFELFKDGDEPRSIHRRGPKYNIQSDIGGRTDTATGRQHRKKKTKREMRREGGRKKKEKERKKERKRGREKKRKREREKKVKRERRRIMARKITDQTRDEKKDDDKA